MTPLEELEPMPGLEIKLVSGSVHLIYFQDEHDRDRFVRELPLLAAITMWRKVDG